jgi:hypothetical protein
MLKSADDYRNLQPESNKKELGYLKYHTYRLQEDKPYTVFIRALHPSTDVNDFIIALQADNMINVQIKKKTEGKSNIVNLPLFKVDLKTAENNRRIYDLRTLCHLEITVKYDPVYTLPEFWSHHKNYCRHNALIAANPIIILYPLSFQLFTKELEFGIIRMTPIILSRPTY